MAVEIQDVLNVNVVLLGVGLLNEQEEFDAFRQVLDTEVTLSSTALIGSVPAAQPPTLEPERTLTLHRDRIALVLSSVRSTIAKEYPSKDDLSRLSEVAAQAISNTNVENRKLQAIGYNIALVYDTHTGTRALKYIADRLLKPPVSVQSKWTLIGGTTKLIFDDGANIWTFILEPRLEENASRLFLSVNRHKNDDVLPTEADIKSSLHDIWRQAYDFIETLDQNK